MVWVPVMSHLNQHQLNMKLLGLSAFINEQTFYLTPCFFKSVSHDLWRVHLARAAVLSLWISCRGEGWTGWTCRSKASGRWEHSRGGKERGREGEGTGLGTQNSLLGWNCNEAAPANHKMLFSSLALWSLTHQTIYSFDQPPRHLIAYKEQ